jgi:hypothetical protein
MSMAVVTVRQAKTRAEAGEEIVHCPRAEPAMKPTPIGTRVSKRRFGALRGKLSLPDAFFFDPLPEHELKRWDGMEDGDSAR